MMVHVLSGQWPFPGEAVQVNPNNPNDVIGVTEFDRREEYINLIGNEHPLMILIQGCLSNSPSHRPTSSEVHQRVSAVAADHPPSFTNRVEMMDRIKALSEEKDRERTKKDSAITEKDGAIMERDRSIAELKEIQSNIEDNYKSHSVEVEALQIAVSDLKADNEHLQATISAKEKMYTLEQEAMKKWHQSEIDTIKHDHQDEIEALKLSYQLDRQSLERRQVLLENEHRTVKQTMTQRHQAQIKSKVSELSAKDALISRKSSTIQSLQAKLGQALGTSSGKDNLSVFSPGVKLTFTECAKTPKSTANLHQGISIGKNVYIGIDYDRKVFIYSITENSWSTLPVAPVKYARIGFLYKKVLVVGGWLPSNQVTADIHEFDEASQQWLRSTSIPPIPTARASLTVVSWSSPPALIICGGSDRQYNPMTVVEVYYSRTSQWHAVTPLPFPKTYITHTVLHNVLYLVGGCEGNAASTYKKRVMTISIPQLLETCLQPSPVQWNCLSISNIPNYWSTAASLGGCLMVVGGVKDLTWPPKPKSIVSSVHAYCPFTSSWVLVGELPQALFSCTTATLPTGELLVIGGASPTGDRDMTYKCSLSM